ncbi:MAG: patatin-like phospholipase family protein [Nitrospira sp.]|nr:patatin-like phospholipase family protein [Nitrospira sp.]
MPDVPSQQQPCSAESRLSTPPDVDVQSMVADRRAKLNDAQRPVPDAGTWGLALSGGGIRSATFCFGLLKALAQNQVFHRFDLLSTVSGGGYIGATVGKLFHNAAQTGQSAEDVEAALADADTRWFAFWLRANGRYLIPRGGKDLLFAVANFGRNLVGVHIELALLCLLLGSLLVGFDLALWQWADCLYSRNTCWQPSWVTMATLDAFSRWPSLWILTPPLILVAASLAAAYWALPSKSGDGLSAQRWIVAALCLVGYWKLLSHWSAQKAGILGPDALQLPGWLLLTAGGVLMGWVFGSIIALVLSSRYPNSPDVSRNRLTAGLARTLKVGLIFFVLGLVDVMAWLLANAKAEHHGAVGTAVVLTMVALRAVLPKIADLPRSLTPGTRINLNGLINLIGVFVLLLLLVFWVSIVHRSATLALFYNTRGILQFSLSWNWLGVITLPAVLMIGLSFRNRDFLNRSSLYTFYRARLVRAYLGAANVARFSGHPQAATTAYQRHEIARALSVSVQDVHPGDDVAMVDYAPHAGGGPVHLVSACVNQTHDPRGGLFNQDRKGLQITVGPQGMARVGEQGWHAVERQAGLTLGAWMAISGAAVAPGLGSSTKSGIASLLTMSGIRLGYWWDARSLQRKAGHASQRHVSKYAQLLAELQGRFDGTDRADWYLSDGGHFENTAAYALLREECALVVVADCGADPRYAFGDLENLVRKVRIDLQAEITFLKPRMQCAATTRLATEPVGSTIFGSLNDLASADSQACLALARIDYRSGKTGYMVVVKPNMCVGLPVDLVNFKADHPLFPQEPTTDQFFSEAQWESYFHLGYTMGLHLQRQMLDDLPRFAAIHFEFDDGSVAVRDERGEVHAAAAPKRLPSRIAATGAVTASVSLGALATLGATAWQAVDKQMKERVEARKLNPAALKELTDLYGKLMPDVPLTSQALADTTEVALTAHTSKVASAAPVGADKSSTGLGEMATALLRVGDATCTPDNIEAFRRSVLMQMIITSTQRRCRETIPHHPSCDVLLNADLSVACLHKQPQVNCNPRYWLRDFNETDSAKQNCLVTPPPQPEPAPDGESVVSELKVFNPLTILEWWGLRSAKAPAPPPPASSGPDGSPTPPAGSAPTPATSSGGSTSPSIADICKGKTVYIQIFGPELRDRVRLLREPWRDLGASVPPVEDVLDTARRRGRNAPQAPSQPTVIYHDADSQACANQLPPSDTTSRWPVRPLSPQLKGMPGTIEVWIPPLPTPTAAQVAPLPRLAFCYQEDNKQISSQRFGVHCHIALDACNSARGPNPHRNQSACVEVDTSTVASVLNRRGWGGSWYALQAKPFGQPFPKLP